MKKYIILFALALFVSFSFAQSTDAVYKKIKKEYTLHTDGSIEYRYYKELKLNTHYSFNRMFGETFIIYNPDFQKLIIHDSYTIMANGRKVETPKNAFNEVLPRAVADYPAYNQMREMVVTHTALEIGATIYLDYSIISKPTYIKEMIGMEVMVERVSVEDFEITLKVPARRNLKFLLSESEQKPKTNNDGTYRVYQWAFKNLGAQSYEQASPPVFDIAPILKFSTFPDGAAEFGAFTSQDAFHEKALPEVQKFIEESKESTFGELELALALQKYIVNNIATKHIPLYWHNYQLQNPAQVWNANVGSVIEKTLLLYRAAQLAGLNAYLVGFYPLSLWNGELLNPENFSDFGVMITFKKGEKTIFSATKMNSKSLEFDHPNNRILNMQTGTIVHLPSLKTIPQISLKASLTIDPNNQIFGDMKLNLAGAALDYIKLVQDTQKIQDYIVNAPPFSEKDLVKGIFKDAIHGEFNVVIKGEAKLKNQENYYFWKVPYLNNGIARNHFTQLTSKRDFPMMVPAIEEEYQYSITLPKSVNWVKQDVHIVYQESFGEMRIDIAMKDGVLQIEKYLKIEPEMLEIILTESKMDVHSQELQANKRMLYIKEYDVFRKMMIDWNSERVNELVFKR